MAKLKWIEIKSGLDVRFIKGIESKNIVANLFKDERGCYARVVDFKTGDKFEIGFPFCRNPENIDLKRAVELRLKRMI